MSVNSKKKSTKNGKMDRSKELALPVLARESNLTKAAKELGIDRDQIYKWLRDEEYRKEVDNLRTALVDVAIGSLKASVSRATAVMVDLLEDENPQIRLKAANDILGHVSKFIELRNFDDRLKELEEAVKVRSSTT